MRPIVVLGHGNRGLRRGGTLMEVLLCVVIMGIAVAAIMQLLASGTSVNARTAELTTGTNLARNGIEWAAGKGWSYLSTNVVNNPQTFSPVINGQGETLTGYSGWSQ